VKLKNNAWLHLQYLVVWLMNII